MLYGYRDEEKHCRWCGCRYKASKPINRDGFCSNACKQAHYRAYKAYVTAKAGSQGKTRRRSKTIK